jgi:acetyl esterase/lipase
MVANKKLPRWVGKAFWLCILVFWGCSDPGGPDDFEKTTYVYKRVDGVPLHADVYRSRGIRVQPVLVWLHGGALIFGTREHVLGDLRSLCQREGYTLVSLDYRLAPETKLPGIIGDIRDGLRWIREQGPRLFQSDQQRMVVAGESAGGYLAMTTGYAVQPPPRALVTYWGYGDIAATWYTEPSPFYRERLPLLSEEELLRLQVPGTRIITQSGPGSATYQNRTRYYTHLRQHGLWVQAVTGLDPNADRAELRQYAPLYNVSVSYPPLLMIHGTEDEDVPHGESAAMARVLTRHGVAHELLSVAGGGHRLEGAPAEARRAARARARAFIREHLH